MLTTKLAKRRLLAAVEFQDNRIAPNAASTVTALTSSRKSATSENAAVASGTRLAYMMSSRTNPKETAVAQAYSPTTSGPSRLVGLF